MAKIIPVDGNPFANDTIRAVEGNPFEEKPFDWQGALRQTLQGMTFGASDEIQSRLRAAIDNAMGGGAHDFGGGVDMREQSLSDKYSMYHDILKNEREQFKKESPKTALAAEIAGGLATGGVGAGKLAAAKGIKNLGNLKKAAAIGAIEGGTYGTLAADPGERLQGGAVGAVAGGTLAPAVQFTGGVVANLARPAAQRAKHAVLGTPGGDAQRLVMDTLAGEGLGSVDELGRANARFPATLADRSEGLANYASGLLAEGNTNALRETKKYLARNAGMTRRALSGLEEGLDIPPDASWHTVSKAIQQSRGETGKKLYGAANEKPLNIGSSKFLKTVFSGKHGTKEVNRALKNAQSTTASNRSAGDQVGHFDLLNQWKMNMDDSIESLLRSGKKNAARGLIAIKNRVIKEADDQIPEYKAARQAWAEDSQILSAGERGKKIFTEDIDELADLVTTMGEPELVAYRIGVKKAVREKLMMGRGGTNTLNRISSDLNLERISKAFPDKKAWLKFKGEIDAEAAAFETYRTLKQNSLTAMRTQHIKNLGDKSPTEVAKWGGDVVGITSNALRRLFSSGLSKAAKDELGTMILTPMKDLPPDVLRKIQLGINKRFDQETGKRIATLFSQATYTPAAAGAIAQPIGGN